MGSWAGAEICELVGLFLRHLLRENSFEAILYRDDGAVMSSNTPRQLQKLAEKILQIFSSQGSSITIEANMQVMKFLDVTLDLMQDEFRPYTKPNREPLYYLLGQTIPLTY